MDDKMQEIYPFLAQCDHVVLASPICFSSLSGPLLNVARRVQTYFAGRFFRGEPELLKQKNGVLLLAGAEPGTERKLLETARIIMKHINAGLSSRPFAPCLPIKCRPRKMKRLFAPRETLPKRETSFIIRYKKMPSGMPGAFFYIRSLTESFLSKGMPSGAKRYSVLQDLEALNLV